MQQTRALKNTLTVLLVTLCLCACNKMGRDLFALQGAATVDLGGDDRVLGVAAIENAELLLVGESDSQAAVARISKTGAVQNSFGENGRKVLTSLGSNCALHAATQHGEKYLVAGIHQKKLLLTALDVSGAQDSSFSDAAGQLLVSIGSEVTEVVSIFVSSGKLYVVGNTLVGGKNAGFTSRFSTEGRIDPSYGSQGVALLERIGNSMKLIDAIAGSNRSIVLVGNAVLPSGESDIVVGRVGNDGNWDGSFAGAGRVQLNVSTLQDGFTATTSEDEATSLTVLSNGTIAVGASFRPTGGLLQAALILLSSDGNVLSAFGSGGVASANFTDSQGEAQEAESVGTVYSSNRRWIIAARVFLGTSSPLYLYGLDDEGNLSPSFGKKGLQKLQGADTAIIRGSRPTGAVTTFYGETNGAADSDFFFVAY